MSDHAVYIEWVDSASTRGWGEHNDASLSICHSVGWLVHKTKDILVISTSIGENNRSIDRLAIPRACIRKVRRVAVQKRGKRA